MLAPRGRQGRLAWDGRLGRSATDTETRTDFQVGPSIRSAGTLVRPYVRAEWLARETAGSGSTVGYAGFEVTALPRLGLPRALAGIWIRADGEVDSRGAASRADHGVKEHPGPCPGRGRNPLDPVGRGCGLVGVRDASHLGCGRARWLASRERRRSGRAASVRLGRLGSFGRCNDLLRRAGGGTWRPDRIGFSGSRRKRSP